MVKSLRAALAQLVERQFCKLDVVCSIQTSGTIFALDPAGRSALDFPPSVDHKKTKK